MQVESNHPSLPTTTITQSPPKDLTQSSHQHAVVPIKDHETFSSGIRHKLTRNKSPKSGTFTFRPIRVVFNYQKDLIGRNHLYSKVKVGLHTHKTQLSLEKGENPSWSDVLIFKAKEHQLAKIKVKEYDHLLLRREKLGEAKISLSETRSKGKTTEWVKLLKKGKIIGQIQLEITFDPNGVL